MSRLKSLLNRQVNNIDMKNLKAMIKTSSILFSGLLMVTLLSDCTGSSGSAKNDKNKTDIENNAAKAEAQSFSDENNNTADTTYKVTFIELGSVRCIPCQQMQPVMKSIQEKYGKQVNVIFYDVWTDAGKPYATKYVIESIPTQVFLDKNGEEFYRHVGFFPEEELVKVLKTKLNQKI